MQMQFQLGREIKYNFTTLFILFAVEHLLTHPYWEESISVIDYHSLHIQNFSFQHIKYSRIQELFYRSIPSIKIVPIIITYNHNKDLAVKNNMKC